MRFIATLVVTVLALLSAPPSAAETAEQAATEICAARARGVSELSIAQVLQAKAPTVDFYNFEQLVLQAEREYCPQYLGGVSQPGPYVP